MTLLQKLVEKGLVTTSERKLIKDFKKLRVLHIDDIKSHHKQSLNSLNDWTKKGLIRKHKIILNNKITHAYSISPKYAGGKALTLSRNCSIEHNVLTSKSYYSLEKPETFRLEADLTSNEKREFYRNNAPVPDAIFTKNGQDIYIESDAGQYTQHQIVRKLTSWKQPIVWNKPRTQAHHPKGEKLYKVNQY